MFKSKWIFFSLILFSLSLASDSFEKSASGMSYERLQKIAPSLNDLYLKNGKFPGFVSAVARKGKVVHFETQGYDVGIDFNYAHPQWPDGESGSATQRRSLGRDGSASMKRDTCSSVPS